MPEPISPQPDDADVPNVLRSHGLRASLVGGRPYDRRDVASVVPATRRRARPRPGRRARSGTRSRTRAWSPTRIAREAWLAATGHGYLGARTRRRWSPRSSRSAVLFLGRGSPAPTATTPRASRAARRVPGRRVPGDRGRSSALGVRRAASTTSLPVLPVGLLDPGADRRRRSALAVAARCCAPPTVVAGRRGDAAPAWPSRPSLLAAARSPRRPAPAGGPPAAALPPARS